MFEPGDKVVIVPANVGRYRNEEIGTAIGTVTRNQDFYWDYIVTFPDLKRDYGFDTYQLAPAPTPADAVKALISEMDAVQLCEFLASVSAMVADRAHDIGMSNPYRGDDAPEIYVGNLARNVADRAEELHSLLSQQ